MTFEIERVVRNLIINMERITNEKKNSIIHKKMFTTYFIIFTCLNIKYNIYFILLLSITHIYSKISEFIYLFNGFQEENELKIVIYFICVLSNCT